MSLPFLSSPGGVASSLVVAFVGFAGPALAQDAPKPAPNPSPPPPKAKQREEGRPTPLQVDYAQYGVAFAGEFLLDPGATCLAGAPVPCILGSGGGPIFRGGYRPSGPFYIGGAYQFAKLDSNNLYRLGILQELRAEMRYYVDVGSRFTPYAEWSLGGMWYGNEFGAQTGGVETLVGVGVEFEVTRFAVIQMNVGYQPMLFVGFDDSAGQQRDTGVAHFIHFDLGIELKNELGRE